MTLAACGGDGGVVPKKPVMSSAVSKPAALPEPPAVRSDRRAHTAFPVSQTCNFGNFQQELINRINQARAKMRVCGGVIYDASSPVTWNAALFKAAADHSTDMSSNNYFSHTSRNGRDPGERMRAAGYAWNVYAENIAAGQTTIDQVMKDWLTSAGHCANIMKPGVTELGVACVKNEASTYKMYWTMDFARSR